MTTEDKKGRGTLSRRNEPLKPICEVDFHIHIEENDEPPAAPGVEIRSIKWVDIKAPGTTETKVLPEGEYILTEQDGTQHLLEWDRGLAYGGTFKG